MEIPEVTSVSVMVNSQGSWRIKHVNFDDATIRAAAYPELNNIVTILRNNLNMRVTMVIGSALSVILLDYRSVTADRICIISA